MVDLIINGRQIKAEKGQTLLDVIKQLEIDIPTLCHHEGLPPRGSCRLCSVEIKKTGWSRDYSKLVTSCLYPVEEGLEVFTHSEKVIKLRKILIELLMARVPHSEKIKHIAESIGVFKTRFKAYSEDEECILCGQCVRACEELGTNAIAMVNRGTVKKVSTPYDAETEECVGCGACAQVCPVDAIKIHETQNTRTVRNQTFELKNCDECGKPFITKAQIDYICKKQKIPPEYFNKCPECKSKQLGHSFKEILKSLRR